MILSFLFDLNSWHHWKKFVTWLDFWFWSLILTHFGCSLSKKVGLCRAWDVRWWRVFSCKTVTYDKKKPLWNAEGTWNVKCLLTVYETSIVQKIYCWIVLVLFLYKGELFRAYRFEQGEVGKPFAKLRAFSVYNGLICVDIVSIL